MQQLDFSSHITAQDKLAEITILIDFSRFSKIIRDAEEIGISVRHTDFIGINSGKLLMLFLS